MVVNVKLMERNTYKIGLFFLNLQMDCVLSA
jgi:hypothetical protein